MNQTQAVDEYVSNALRGSNLPYDEDIKWIVREHLVELQKVFPSLNVSASEFYAADGRRLQLFKAEGTIPVHYMGSKYNIPIVLWLPEHYPRVAPLAYVVPTSSMVIKSGHSCVDRNGQCTPPLLRSWNYPQNNNLVELALQLSQVFGAEPPLYSQPGAAPKPPAATASSSSPSLGTLPQTVQPPPNYPSIGAQQQYPGPGPYSGQPSPGLGPSGRPASEGAAIPVWPLGYLAAGAAGGRTPSPASEPGRQSQGPPLPGVLPYGSASTLSRPPPPPPRPPPPPTISRADVEGPAKKLAAAALQLQLSAVERSYQVEAVKESDALLDIQRQLLARKAQLQSMVATLKQEREGTEGVVKEMGHKSEQLQRWLEVNEPKAFVAAQSSDQDLLKCWVPVDELSQQGLEAHAEDMAIEDIILALDRALQAEKAGLTVDQYLKQIRALCRRQFFARALGLKVAQQQAKRPPPAPGHTLGQTLPYPVVHGDSWTGQAAGQWPPPPPPHP